MRQQVGDLGEFQLIRRLLARVGASGNGVEVGPGDDAAVVHLNEGTVLATADVLVEGVHFEIGFSTPADVGWKALAVNLSDVAAMGGTPRFALVSLGVPAGTPVTTLEHLYEGMDECATAFSVIIVGGDTVRADALVISVAVLGETGDVPVVTRSGAHPGDVVCVTGALGAAAAGLELLRAGAGDERAAELIHRFPGLTEAHRRPRPRVGEGVAAARMGATAMIDLSDGLGSDLARICEASGVGATLEASSIPLADGVAETAALLGRDPVELALGGGDDYELALTILPERLEGLRNALGATPVVLVGEVVAGEGARLRSNRHADIDLASLGWDHFAEGR